MYVIITRAPDGAPAVHGPHPQAPTMPRQGRTPAFAIPLFPAEQTTQLPRVVALTSDMTNALASAAPAPDDAAPAVLLAVAPASRLLIAVGPFDNAAQARSWSQRRDADLKPAGIVCVTVAVSAPHDLAGGGDR